jgi:hypothetical protein
MRSGEWKSGGCREDEAIGGCVTYVRGRGKQEMLRAKEAEGTGSRG